MAIDLEYPVYLVPVPGGYASVVSQQPDGEPVYSLAVFLDEERALRFMETCNLSGSPRPLNNAREFRWLLQSLKEPVTQVAFDPSPDAQELVARWIISFEELLNDHIVADHSPWNYPVFVIAQGEGFVSIAGSSDAGQSIQAVALFSSADKAHTYLQAAAETGTVMELANMSQTRTFLSALADSLPAVALDPVVAKQRRVARYCFRIEMLLEKYLVESHDDHRSD